MRYLVEPVKDVPVPGELLEDGEGGSGRGRRAAAHGVVHVQELLQERLDLQLHPPPLLRAAEQLVPRSPRPRLRVA